MVGNNGDTIDQLDQFWDEKIRGTSSRPPALEPAFATAVRRLHGLNDAAAPNAAFARRLWTDLSHPAAAVSPSAVRRPPPVMPIAERHLALSRDVLHGSQIPRQARNDGVGARNDKGEGTARHDRGKTRISRVGWQGGFAQFLTLAILVLALAAGYAAFRPQPPSKPRLSAVSDPGASELYAFVFNEKGESDTDRWEATPLNPTTLADRSTDGADVAQPPAWAGVLSEKWANHLWALSGDGSTYVAVETWPYVNGVAMKEATIGVYDAQTGAARIRFDLPTAVRDARLSRDGARLVLQADSDPPEWYVVDTADGHVIAKIESDEQNGWHADSWIDLTASRLYRLLIPYPRPVNNGPGPARLVANDLTTGAEIGLLELPDVRSGVWGTGRTYEVSPGVEYPIFGELRPGAALSPDGKTLAIVHADEDAVTHVDAERLVVERTEPLTRPTGLGDRLLSLLIPTDAAAKGPGEGTNLQAVFAADGRHLYVFGFETTFDRDGADSRSLGLRLIDLETAEIVADADELADGFFADVIPSPNGRDLYVIGSQPPDVMWSDGVLTRLWRLDAATLEELTTRDFTETPRIIVSPAVPDGRGQVPPGAG